MASSFLVRCGRGAAVKILKQQAWSLRSLPSTVPSTVSLCTKQGDSGKGSKKGSTKNKSENIISTISEETVKLTDEDLEKFWARKTLVTFPQRPTFPSLERDHGFSSTGGSNEKPDEESSSSSSSESDSSSDSDDEDNAIKDTKKTTVEFPRRDPISSEERTVKENTVNEQQSTQRQKQESAPEKHLYSPKITVFPVKKKKVVFPRQDSISSENITVMVNTSKQHAATPQNDHAPQYTPRVTVSPFKDKGVVFPRQDPISSEKRTVKVNTSKQHTPALQNDHAPQHSPRITEPLIKNKRVHQTIDKLLELVKHATKQTSKETNLKGLDLVINPAEILSGKRQKHITNHLETSLHESVSSKLSKTQEQTETAQSQTLPRQEGSAARGRQDATSQEGGTVGVQEELMGDSAPVTETTMKEEITLETGIRGEEQSIAQEVKAAAETAQEAIDISTYKNLQYHEYTPFTFVDFDVDLSKFWLPQPSSGRGAP